MRNNPIPLVLTLAGVTWLVASSYNRRQPPGQDLQSRFARSGVGQKLHERASTARDRLHSAADSARQRFSGTSAEGEIGSEFDEYGMSERTGRFSSKLHSARDTARARVGQAQERVYNMLEEQPLVAGALAVAIGAILGTVLPSTSYENRMLGPARERALSRAQQLGEQQYENLKDTLQTQGTGASQTQSPGAESGLSGRA